MSVCIVDWLYRATIPILDPVTKKKLVFLRGEAARRRYAQAHWTSDGAMAAWLDAVFADRSGKPGSFPPGSGLRDECARALLRAMPAPR